MSNSSTLASVTHVAPDFTATAVMPDNAFESNFKLTDHRGRYVLLFFYPLDFTFVCPSEIIAFDRKLQEFKERNCEVIGVLVDDSVSLRGLFLIDKEGVIRHALVNDLPLGRSVDEAIRILDALQFTEEHGEVCPANWMKGDDAMKPTAEGVADYPAKRAG